MKKEESIMARLKQERKRLGITQVELAKRIGMTQPQLSTLEITTKSPSWNTITRYAKGLGFDVHIKFIKRKDGNDEEKEN